MKQFIDVSFDDKEYSMMLKKTKIIKWIKSVLKELDLKDHSCSVLFTSNEKITELNNQYFNKNYPTNIISFSQIEGENIDFIKNKFLGDLVISVPYAVSFIKDKSHTLEEEINFLILHGILHLLGMDHENDNGEMDKKQQELYHRLTGVLLE
jgi:probable rRNA maturation factor